MNVSLGREPAPKWIKHDGYEHLPPDDHAKERRSLDANEKNLALLEGMIAGVTLE